MRSDRVVDRTVVAGTAAASLGPPSCPLQPVHGPSMALPAADRMSAMVASYDVVILGAGSGGYACALRAAQLGLSVAMVEKDKVGGTCLHRGCIPTKALLHAAEVADAAREGEQFGVKTSLAGIDMDGVQDYAASVVNRIHTGLTGLVKARKITYVEGEGR